MLYVRYSPTSVEEGGGHSQGVGGFLRDVITKPDHHLLGEISIDPRARASNPRREGRGEEESLVKIQTLKE